MSTKRDKKTRFLEQHPHCCFCGGGTPAVEIDHLPSRACFDERGYPEGFEFPTCRDCNASTSDAEQIVALLSRMLSNPKAPAKPEEIGRYMKGVANNSAGFFAEMVRGVGTVEPDGCLFELGDDTQNAFKKVLTRWAKAFHYRETGMIVPLNARVLVLHFSNANAHLIPPAALDGELHELKRNGKNIGDQFCYITKTDPNHPGLGYYTAGFRRSFLAVLLVDCFRELPVDDADLVSAVAN